MGDQVILKFVVEGDVRPSPAEVEAMFSHFEASVEEVDGVYIMEMVPGELDDYGGVIWQISCDLREQYPGAFLIQ